MLSVIHRFDRWITLLIASPLAAWKAPSDTMRASPQGGDFSLFLFPPRPVPKAHGAFSNRVLLSSTERQPRTMSITYIVRESLTSPDLKGRVPMLGTGILLDPSL